MEKKQPLFVCQRFICFFISDNWLSFIECLFSSFLSDATFHHSTCLLDKIKRVRVGMSSAKLSTALSSSTLMSYFLFLNNLIGKFSLKIGFKAYDSVLQFESLKTIHLIKYKFFKFMKFLIFTFSSWMRRYWFYVKNDFRNFHQIFTFWDTLSQKKGFYESVCLSVCL